MGYLTPQLLGPVGVQPNTIDFIGYNSATATTFPVGTVMMFDLSMSNAATTKTAPGSGSIWANMRIYSTANAGQRWAPTAVYMGNEKGEAVSLAPLTKGKFRLCGIVPARVVNTNATLPSDAASGVPLVATSLGADGLGSLNCRTADFIDGERVIGWTLQTVPGVDLDATTLAAEAAKVFTVYFNGEGIATWYTP